MILAIDIGNTNIVVGCCADNKVLFSERISTNHTATALEYAVSLIHVLELNGINACNIKGSVISSVVPSVTGSVADAVKKITGSAALIVKPGMNTGLSILIDNPAQMGSDMVVDSVAAIEHYKPPIAVIDMGTATTVSVIDRDKNCIGGLIIPGMRISLDALIGRTSQLPKISLEAPEKIICKNTVDCMKGGVVFGAASMLDGLLDRVEEELNEKIMAVATGGLAELIIPNCKRNIILDKDLLLKGLMILYDRNN